MLMNIDKRSLLSFSLLSLGLTMPWFFVVVINQNNAVGSFAIQLPLTLVVSISGIILIKHYLGKVQQLERLDAAIVTYFLGLFICLSFSDRRVLILALLLAPIISSAIVRVNKS